MNFINNNIKEILPDKIAQMNESGANFLEVKHENISFMMYKKDSMEWEKEEKSQKSLASEFEYEQKIYIIAIK